MRTTYLVALVISASSSSLALRSNMPISIAEIFWPPSMNYIAWVPGAEDCLCSSAVPVEENKVFSIGGEDGFTYGGFWGNSMKLMKDGKEIADCVIGPDAVQLDMCEATRDSQYYGIIKKRWTCWTRSKDTKMHDASKGGSGTSGGAAKPYWES